MNGRYSARLVMLIMSAILTPAMVYATPSSQWLAHSSTYEDWQEKERDCERWSPSRKDVDWGQTLRQSQSCVVTDLRHKVIREKNKYTQEIRTREKKEETRLRKISSWRTTTGQRDRLLSTVTNDTWSEWQLDQETLHSCEWITPSLTKQSDLGTPVLRLKQCQGDAERRKAVHEHWLSGKKIRLWAQEEHEIEEQSFVLTRVELGEQDRWLPAKKRKTRWVTSPKMQCNPWVETAVAHAKTRAWGTQTLLPRQCKQDKQRDVITEQFRLSGERKELARQVDTSTKTFTQWRVFMGERDDVIDEQWYLTSDWSLKSNGVVCVPSSLSDNVPWGQAYTFYQECEGQMQQEYRLMGTHLSGRTSVLEVRIDEKEETIPMLQLAKGARDGLLVANAQERVSDWTNDGNQSCGGWLPLNTTFVRDRHFLQYRDCEQNQQRYKESMSRWRSGDKWVVTDHEFKQERFVEMRHAKGVKLPSSRVDGVRLAMTETGEVSSPVEVGEVTQYDRLMVEVTRRNGQQTLTLSLQHPSGEIALPSFDKTPKAYFFNLADYQVETAGEWRLVNHGEALSEAEVIEITLHFQASAK